MPDNRSDNSVMMAKSIIHDAVAVKNEAGQHISSPEGSV